MRSHDPLEQWTSERAREAVPDGFADRVMAAVRDRSAAAEGNERRSREILELRPLSHRAVRVALAACAALACHAALVGAIWLAWPHVAQ
jgi:hypothetical protein